MGLKIRMWKSLAMGMVRSQWERMQGESRRAEGFRTSVFKGTAKEEPKNGDWKKQQEVDGHSSNPQERGVSWESDKESRLWVPDLVLCFFLATVQQLLFLLSFLVRHGRGQPDKQEEKRTEWDDTLVVFSVWLLSQWRKDQTCSLGSRKQSVNQRVESIGLVRAV